MQVPPVPPCFMCNMVPAWVEQVLAPNALEACFFNESRTVAWNCSVDSAEMRPLCTAVNVSDCTTHILCPAEDARICAEAAARGRSKLPLAMLSAPSDVMMMPATNSTGMAPRDNTSQANSGNTTTAPLQPEQIPSQLPRALLPRVVMAALQATLFGSMSAGVVLPTPQLPAGFGCANNTRSCWVDADLALNMVAGALLESRYGCVTSNDDPAAQANQPFSACHAWTLRWQEPASPCPPDAAQADCISATFRFQLESWTMCAALEQGNATSLLPMARSGVELPGANENNTQSVELCGWDSRMHMRIQPGVEGPYNMETFGDGGVLNSLLHGTGCSSDEEEEIATEESDEGCVMYALTTDTLQLPAPVFALPSESYMEMGGLLELAWVPGATSMVMSGMPWCNGTCSEVNNTTGYNHTMPGSGSGGMIYTNVDMNYTYTMPQPSSPPNYCEAAAALRCIVCPTISCSL